MDQESFQSREAYLKSLLTRITAATDELRRIEEGGAGDYGNTYRKLSELRERYRQQTGMYPRLPPSWRGG